ncbi:MAG: hypothetical protein M3323_07820 [Actinomycetota bacterium]|nr:hypothetical protein [Actinomycetota bacterium]
MAKCDICGNEYDKSFEVRFASQPGDVHTFDSFECAIHALAPVCEHCGCKVIGHGVEADGAFYCCAHCAGAAGVTGVSDRAG